MNDQKIEVSMCARCNGASCYPRIKADDPMPPLEEAPDFCPMRNHEEVIERVWGYRSDGNNTALKNLVYRIRRKVELDPVKPQIVQTVVGIGYKFVHE